MFFISTTGWDVGIEAMFVYLYGVVDAEMARRKNQWKCPKRRLAEHWQSTSGWPKMPATAALTDEDMFAG